MLQDIGTDSTHSRTMSRELERSPQARLLEGKLDPTHSTDIVLEPAFNVDEAESIESVRVIPEKIALLSYLYTQDEVNNSTRAILLDQINRRIDITFRHVDDDLYLPRQLSGRVKELKERRTTHKLLLRGIGMKSYVTSDWDKSIKSKDKVIRKSSVIGRPLIAIDHRYPNGSHYNGDWNCIGMEGNGQYQFCHGITNLFSQNVFL